MHRDDLPGRLRRGEVLLEPGDHRRGVAAHLVRVHGHDAVRVERDDVDVAPVERVVALALRTLGQLDRVEVRLGERRPVLVVADARPQRGVRHEPLPHVEERRAPLAGGAVGVGVVAHREHGLDATGLQPRDVGARVGAGGSGVGGRAEHGVARGLRPRHARGPHRALGRGRAVDRHVERDRRAGREPVEPQEVVGPVAAGPGGSAAGEVRDGLDPRGRVRRHDDERGGRRGLLQERAAHDARGERELRDEQGCGERVEAQGTAHGRLLRVRVRTPWASGRGDRSTLD